MHNFEYCSTKSSLICTIARRKKGSPVYTSKHQQHCRPRARTCRIIVTAKASTRVIIKSSCRQIQQQHLAMFNKCSNITNKPPQHGAPCHARRWPTTMTQDTINTLSLSLGPRSLLHFWLRKIQHCVFYIYIYFKDVSREFDEFRVNSHLCKLRCWYL